VPRQPRCRRASGSLEPGRIYHVTNRGVDRCDIFHSDLDRVLFLSCFAEACVRFGAVCHAWCLMTNHLHLVVEDTRGMLSQLMHRVESAYARYFNDTRRRRRRGPLFESRFRAELIHSTDYFEAACAYVVLNPLETRTPMATSAEAYRWSSAAMVCSDTTPVASIAALIEPFGGMDAILERFPPSRRKSSIELRRARLEALASGAWLEREHVLAGRSPDEYLRMLASRAERMSEIAIDEKEQTEPEAQLAEGESLASRPPFAGFELPDVEVQIRSVCDRLIPGSFASPERLRDLVLYSLHRFTTASFDALARVGGISAEAVRWAIERIGADRLITPAWGRMLWTLEWALRWKLLAAPYRP
jgi:REP element-mobilizing transposase RayT